jgi:hypothetical protein
MTHHSTLVQRCRQTNKLLADELEREFARLENDRSNASDEIERLRAKITKADYLLTQSAPSLALEALQ